MNYFSVLKLNNNFEKLDRCVKYINNYFNLHKKSKVKNGGSRIKLITLKILAPVKNLRLHTEIIKFILIN